MMSLRLTYNHCRLFLFPPGKGPKQDPTNQAWACQWCPKEYIASWGSYYNLKAHRDGAMIKGCLRGACTGRQKAIQAGSHIPLSVSERNLAKAQGRPTGQGTLIGYTTRGRFDNQTLNKLIVVWIIRQSLPWLQIEDFLLRVAFNYTTNTAQLHSRVWAAAKAHQLYLEQQAQVIKEIKDSKSKLSLVSDVWTKKGSHKAFIGMTACYITPDWTYKCHHLAIKYVSWHHNGKYLATPFANVLVKHGLHHKITHKTDSGSNNFTMAKGVAAIFRRVDSTYWDVEKNHHQCICHLIALILRAGLKALKLLTGMVRPEKTDQSFPLLYTIVEEEEPPENPEIAEAEIVEVFTSLTVTEEPEVDPDDAQLDLPQAGWEWNNGEEVDDICDESGIGWTLKKIDYICRRIASNPPKQAEWKLWATELKYTGKGLIGGYGIRWNITYNCRQQAYDGRKVIKRLLENEDGRLAGKSAKDHYFKSYELTSKEWEEINNLNDLEVLPRIDQTNGGGRPKTGNVVTNKYIELAINWDTVVLATFLHPTWRMKLIHKQFESHVPRITDMILEIFQARDMYLKSLQPETPPVDPQSDANGEAADLPSDSDGDEFNFYPQDSQAIEVNTELERYNNGNFPLDKKGCFLGWWKSWDCWLTTTLPARQAQQLWNVLCL
ncbi:hypothetical protein Pst134EB_029908 [Puccinia striiformis f. sp. tritici]|nr:hypothetical protein Pst134EB_029908 [Puccinia striiformis f. sp. tritici]